jgi:uncharacterized protein (DUF4213/DUF364 family)
MQKFNEEFQGMDFIFLEPYAALLMDHVNSTGQRRGFMLMLFQLLQHKSFTQTLKSLNENRNEAA